MSGKALVWLAAAGVVALVVGLFLFLFSTGRFVTGTIDYVTASLVNMAGMNPLLARGIVILATIPFFWAVAKYTRTIVGFRRIRPSLELYLNPYGLVIVTYVSAFFLAMYLSSRSAYFGLTTGETLKWCADTIEGIRVFDSPGVDPVYGVKLSPCSAAQIASLRAREVGLVGPKRVDVKDARTFEFFEGISGRPKVWYQRTPEGAFELFDGPGKHPTTGQDLKAINAGAVSEIVRLYDENSRRERQRAVERAEQEDKQLAQARDAAARATREAMINRYLNRSVSDRAGGSVLVVDASGRIDQYLTKDIALGISGSTELFKPAFVQDGLFGRAFRGDASDFTRLGLERTAASIVLGTVRSVAASEKVADQTLVKTHTTIVLRVYRTTQGFPSRVLTAAGEGVAFTGALAEKKAREAALHEAIARLSDAR